MAIINENDAVATEEIKFGDNDRLAALVAEAVEADALVLMTRAGGLYTGDPETDAAAQHIPYVPQITDEFRSFATGTKNHLSTGGMESKLEAATIATTAGIPTVICSGLSANPLAALVSCEQEKFTYFAPQAA
jgi:glutamate 5-kinase